MSGVLALVITSKKKKFIFLFLMYVSACILSFALFSGFVFIIIGFVFIFFFIILYIVFIHGEIIKKSSPKLQKPVSKAGLQNRRRFTKNVLNIALPLLLCGGSGYLIFKSTYRYLAEAGKQNGDQPYIISFTDPNLVIKSIFSSYDLIVIFLVSALFISFLWFIIIIKLKDKNKNGEEE